MKLAVFNYDIFPEVIYTLNDYCDIEIAIWLGNYDRSLLYPHFNDILFEIGQAQIQYDFYKNQSLLIDECKRFKFICERHFTYDFDEKYRRHEELFYHGISYFIKLFKEFEIDCYLNSTYPHEIVDFLAYVACKILNIKIIIFAENFYSAPPTFQVIHCLENYSQLTTKRNSNKKSDIESQITIDYLDTNFGLKGHKIKSHAKSYNVSRYEHLHMSTITKSFRYSSYLFKHLGSERFLNSLVVDHKKFDKFVLCALHHQPEGVLTSLSKHDGNNQIEFVLKLRSIVPKYLPIIVKENPVNSVFYRDKQFYQFINKLENTYLVDKTIDVKELLPRAVAVASICGNIGLEALLHEKPVIYSGFPMYRDFNGAFDLSNLKKFDVVTREKVSRQSVFTDWKKLNLQSFRGCNTSLGVSNLQNGEMKENIENLLLALTLSLSLPPVKSLVTHSRNIHVFKTELHNKRMKEKFNKSDFFIILWMFCVGQLKRFRFRSRFNSILINWHRNDT